MEEKNARLQALIEGIIYKLAPITNVYNVYVDKNTTLAKKLSEIITSLNGKAKSDDVGDVSELITEAKDSIVSAINEVYGKIGSSIDENAIYQIVAEYLTENPPSGIHIGTEAPTDPNVDVWIDTDEEAPENENGIDVIAEVGQTIVVEAVDADGKPTAWKAVDFPEAQQSDWNAAEGEPGHVLNRTHYAEIVEKELSAEQEYSFTEGMAMLADVVPLEKGKTYKVSFDGVLYNCVAFECMFMDAYTIAIGNGAIFGYPVASNEPFAIATVQAAGMSGAMCTDTLNHTIKIAEDVEEVHTIPKKYIQNSIPFYVEIGSNYISATPNEIKTALENGRAVIGVNGTRYFNLNFFNGISAGFWTFDEGVIEDVAGGNFDADAKIKDITKRTYVLTSSAN